MGEEVPGSTGKEQESETEKRGKVIKGELTSRLLFWVSRLNFAGESWRNCVEQPFKLALQSTKKQEYLSPYSLLKGVLGEINSLYSSKLAQQTPAGHRKLSGINGHFDYFCILVIVNHAAMSIKIHISFQISILRFFR